MREQLISRTTTRLPPKSGHFFPSGEGKSTLFFQPKLSVGPVDDVYEREADAVADKVMRMPGQDQIQTKVSPLSTQRKCSKCQEEEEKVQRKEKGRSTANSEAHDLVNHALQTGGHSLDGGTKSFMENRLGYDFSQVKVHTGAVAAKSAQSINALAYTSGNSIVFNEGQYAPGTDSGKRLLAHELTHVVQQGGSNKVQRACGAVEVGAPKGCASPLSTAPESPRYLFNTGCNTFIGDNEVDLRADAQSYENGDTIEIHGLASEEGNPDFNLNLSCARALKAKEVIEQEASSRGIVVNILIYAHGPISGEYATINRSIAVVRHSNDAGQSDTQEDPPSTAEEQVYVCSKELDRSPLGRHLFFRIGSPAKSSPAFSLQPEAVLGDCWQGIPMRNSSSDQAAEANCNLLSGVTPAMIETEHNGYPVGQYCTLGPNSNTYVGVILSNLGLPLGTVPAGWHPGVDSSTPAVATFSEDRETTLVASCFANTCAQYRIEGTFEDTDLFLFSLGGTHVTASMNVLVTPTCNWRSTTSGRFGHVREVEVVPDNSAAISLFGSTSPRFVLAPLLVCVNNSGIITPRC